jgi:hypothetical protein
MGVYSITDYRNRIIVGNDDRKAATSDFCKALKQENIRYSSVSDIVF